MVSVGASRGPDLGRDKIELIDENSIITQKPLKYNFDDLKEFKIHIDELLENNYIQESNSKHTSPAFIVIKHSE